MVEWSAGEMSAYAQAFEWAPIGQAVLTVEGRFLAANPALHTLLEHPPGKLLDLRISDVLESDDADAFHAMVGRLVGAPQEQRDRTARQEQSYLTGGGTVVVTGQSVSLVRSPDAGEPRVLVQLAAPRRAGAGCSPRRPPGTCYASLRYLATMPVSGVKVDRSFTAGLPDNTVSRKIVRAIAALGADLELFCTVEGVETAAQQDALPEGVRVQGWYTGIPLDAASVDLPALARSFG